MEFKNQSGLDFIDISSEKWRKYEFSGGATIVILEPQKLHVSDNGHRIFDSSGVSHYIPMSWIHLSWEAKKGSPNFVA